MGDQSSPKSPTNRVCFVFSITLLATDMALFILRRQPTPPTSWVSLARVTVSNGGQRLSLLNIPIHDHCIQRGFTIFIGTTQTMTWGSASYICMLLIIVLPSSKPHTAITLLLLTDTAALLNCIQMRPSSYQHLSSCGPKICIVYNYNYSSRLLHLLLASINGHVLITVGSVLNCTLIWGSKHTTTSKIEVLQLIVREREKTACTWFCKKMI